MRIRTRLRPGIYWDDHNIQRPCVVLEMIDVHGEITIVTALDKVTRDVIPDPPSAIPIHTSNQT